MNPLTSSTTLAIAWRNLWRNRRRTILALSAIGLSVTLVLAYNGVSRAYSAWMLDAITGPMLGHVQVHASLWREDRAMDRTIPRASAALSAIRHDPDVVDASPRVYAPALAAIGEEGLGIVVVGVDVAAESGSMRLLQAGQTLPPRQVLVGRALAEQMGAAAGNTIAIVGQGVDGSLADILVTVHQVVDSQVDEINRHAILMPIDEARELFAFGDEAHEIIVHLAKSADASAVSRRLAGLPDLAGLEVLDWRAISPDLVNILGVVDTVGFVALLLVFVAAAAGVANTMLMATFERTHEFGMLLALGTSPFRIVRMIVAESIALGMVGAGVGAVVGIALVAITGRTGVDFARLTGGGPGSLSAFGMRFSLVFYPALEPADVVSVLVAVITTALVASLWPAVRAARLEPARALRA